MRGISNGLFLAVKSKCKNYNALWVQNVKIQFKM
jgi:hypothetical protein